MSKIIRREISWYLNVGNCRVPERMHEISLQDQGNASSFGRLKVQENLVGGGAWFGRTQMRMRCLFQMEVFKVHICILKDEVAVT